MHSHTTMRSLLSISTIFVPFLTSTTSASSPIIPQQQQQQQQQQHQTPFHSSSSSKETPPSPPLPLLIWHGLGDQYDAPGLHTIGDLAQEIHPDTYVHYIRLAPSGSEDRRATFFGNLTEQLDVVCTSLREDERIWNHRNRNQKGSSSVLVDALGFSQGGQFLRGLIETCEGLRVRSLVTVGAQHNGIAAIGRTCGTWDFLCKGAVAVMRGNAYTEYVQGTVVPAQYYRTLNDTKEGGGGDKEEEPEPVDEYLEFSNFLARVNAERKEEREQKKNSVYKARLTQLQKFVMVVFEDDTTVIPKESGWFAEVNRTSGKITPLRERKIYREDWIGLKALDEKSALVFESMEGDHMQLDDEVLSSLFEKYFGPEKVFPPSHDEDNDDNEDYDGGVKQQQRTVRPRPRPCSGKKKLWNSKMEAWRRSWDAPIKEYL